MNWTNYDDVLRQLREAGLQVDTLEVGARQRCRIDGDRERRGWYHLHEIRTDGGDMLIVGSYGIWRGNDPGSQKVELAKGTPMSADQRAALKRRIADDRKAEQARRRNEAQRAARRAASAWSKLSADGDSEYLRRKCVQAHGVRFSATGTLVIPLCDAHGKVHGLQAIYPPGHKRRKQLQRDKDFWPPGLAKQGHFFLIGNPPAGAACLVAEGYATAASLHEASGLPVVVAFDAGNLQHVAVALRARYRGLRLLICADDDYLAKCRECRQLTPTFEPACRHCGKDHRQVNSGISGADAAALAVDGHVIKPVFAAERPLDCKGPTDFNDLHVAEGLHVVRAQVEARLSALKWVGRPQAAPTHPSRGEGDAASRDLVSVNTVEELQERFALVYEASDVVFDAQEHKLVPLSSMRNLCSSRQVHRWWMESIDKRIVRLEEVGFDPTERDETIKCNLWSGWPTKPRAGRCEKLLELGEFLCSESAKAAEMWRWLLCWVAFPIQHPGAKMKTAVIMHGAQGTGKSIFFESVLAIYGKYGRLLNQDAVEDKFNDWASCLLMGVADEMVARDEMYHAKNKLKTLITSDRVRINPKNLASHYERNHANLAFLSNENQPMALERDDRRYGVIYTPAKRPEAFYNEVLREIREGGIAALHHHLLHMDLGDFGPATLPPLNEAKEDLIELGMESTERFFNEWTREYLPVALPVRACRSEDLYAAYRHWCVSQGVMKPAQLATFVGSIAKRPGVRKARKRHFKNYSHQAEMQSVIITPPGAEDIDGKQALADSINAFNEVLKAWKDQSGTPFKPRESAKAVANGAPANSRDDDDSPY